MNFSRQASVVLEMLVICVAVVVFIMSVVAAIDGFNWLLHKTVAYLS